MSRFEVRCHEWGDDSDYHWTYCNNREDAQKIVDEESKKGFLALVRQSYLLGKLRTNIVSIFILFLNSLYLFIGR